MTCLFVCWLLVVVCDFVCLFVGLCLFVLCVIACFLCVVVGCLLFVTSFVRWLFLCKLLLSSSLMSGFGCYIFVHVALFAATASLMLACLFVACCLMLGCLLACLLPCLLA